MTARAFAALTAVFIFAGPAGASNFEDLLPGAKAMGMGGAFSAVGNDPFGLFYNAAAGANIPYLESAFDLGRLDSPKGPLSFGSLAYERPYARIDSATAGAGYLTERQADGAAKDEFLFNYAQQFKLPELFLAEPLSVGGNFKFVNVDQPANGPSHFGVGLDAGAIARSRSGFSAALGINDVTSNVGVLPSVTLGSAYVYQHWLTVSGDFRVRAHLAEFYPGVEAAFEQGMFDVRLGRGLQLDGYPTIAVGFGVNLSPLTFDVALEIPSNDLNRPAGGYQASLSYRFGAPSFASRFVGSASAQAADLRAQILDLQERQKQMSAAAQAATNDSDIAKQELKILNERVQELTDQYLTLQKQKDRLDYSIKQEELSIAPPTPAPPPPPKKEKPKPVIKITPKWPQTRVVQDGDTLRSLARQYYGDAGLWEAIYDANKDKIDRGVLTVGSEITIPAPPQ